MRLMHDIPGRLRVVVPGLKGDARRAARLRARLRALPGVRAVSANPVTGSLVLEHDDAPEVRARVLSALGPVTPGPARGETDPVLPELGQVVAKAVMEEVVAHALRLAVAAII